MLRLKRGGKSMDIVLFAIVIVLLVVFFVRQNSTSNEKQEVSIRKPTADTAGKLIDERIHRITDGRSDTCVRESSAYKTTPVSIIIDFSDYAFYDLKMTIGSVLRNTPAELIGEILMVDDGSSLDYIREDAKKYAEKIPKAKLIRLDTKVPVGKAKMHGATKAVHSTLVFLSTHVICNVGWLGPLLEHLYKVPTSLAVPHMDNINDPISYEYIKTDDNMASEFTWSLSVVSQTVGTGISQETGHISSIVMRGDAFAVRKDTLTSLGGFDEILDEIVSVALEMSFRAWRCGSSVHVIPCSRVGVMTLNHPNKVMQPEGMRRVAGLWLSERYSAVFYNSFKKPELSQEEKHLIQVRQDQLKSRDCKDLDWYMSTVASSMFVPSKTASAFGFLKVRNGLCMVVGKQSRVDLLNCDPKKTGLSVKDMMFDYGDMMFQNKGMCLSVTDDLYIIAEQCAPDNKRQQWSFDNGVIKNSFNGKCALHVTDPDESIDKARQIAMSQECDADKEDGKFSRWGFIQS